MDHQNLAQSLREAADYIEAHPELHFAGGQIPYRIHAWAETMPGDLRLDPDRRFPVGYKDFANAIQLRVVTSEPTEV